MTPPPDSMEKLAEKSVGSSLLREGLGASVERHLRGYFAAHKGQLPASGLYDRVLREVEKPLLELALAACNGNQIKAALLLGLNRNTLRTRLKRHGIRSR